ncbi:hypothetical protein AN1V17_28480 [Vallitalea sediminicola]
MNTIIETPRHYRDFNKHTTNIILDISTLLCDTKDYEVKIF